jgi:hypothetical protein
MICPGKFANPLRGDNGREVGELFAPTANNGKIFNNDFRLLPMRLRRFFENLQIASKAAVVGELFPRGFVQCFSGFTRVTAGISHLFHGVWREVCELFAAFRDFRYYRGNSSGPLSPLAKFNNQIELLAEPEAP